MFFMTLLSMPPIGPSSRNAAPRMSQPGFESEGCGGRASRKFKSARQAQRFLGAHAAVYNLFNHGRHLVRAGHYRNLREGALAEWGRAVA